MDRFNKCRLNASSLHSGEVFLNGQPLSDPPAERRGDLPTISPTTVAGDNETSVEQLTQAIIAPHSINFFIFPYARIAACLHFYYGEGPQ